METSSAMARVLLLPAFLLLASGAAVAGPVRTPPARHFTITREWTSPAGRKIRYTLEAGDTYLVDEKGQPNASIFSFAYLKDVPPAERASRPVLFAFNGGPGSSSLWLHIGILGPRRVRLPDPVHPPTVPPFTLRDNPYWILDSADIVLIDPVGTGFSRAVGSGTVAQFAGQVPDAVSVTCFIETWLRRNHRWNSPKFLLGESYGTIRAALVANMLFGGAGSPSAQFSAVTLNGVILLGQAVALPEDADLAAVTTLPSFAATAWYDRRVDRKGRSLSQFFEAAQHFADGEYRDSLFAGDRLPVQERASVAATAASYIGLPTDEILAHNLRVGVNEFRVLLLKPEGEEVGGYDSRYAYPESPAGSDSSDVVADDAAMGQYSPAFITAFDQYVRGELGVDVDRPYEAINFAVFRQFEAADRSRSRPSAATAGQQLAAAMRRNPKMRLMVGSGYYDLYSTADNAAYQFAHMGLPPDRVALKRYPAGHMIYIGDKSSVELATDLRAFIAASDK